MFTFVPLQGALSESTASQHLLELDGGVKVLIDVGWDESFDVEKLKELEKQVPTLSLILLTHATVSHLAAYAHCCKNFPLFNRIPVYATRPVIDLGRTLLQDLYASTPAAATTITHGALAETTYAYSQPQTGEHNFLRQAPTSEEIARYFSLIQPLKYSQPHQPLGSPFSPPLNGLQITAYNSGHTLGGTIWHIQHGLESIVYAVDWNQARENVFAGAAWLGGGHGGAEVIEQLRKPTALVCSSRAPASLSRAKRDEHLLDNVRACVAKGGTVLIPVDSSARVLELAYLMEHAWRTDASGNGSALSTAKLYLAGRSVSSTMRHARSMFEWMDDSIVREFEVFAEGAKKANGNAEGTKGKEAGPFDFKYLRLLERKAQIERLLSQAAEDGSATGRVILASDTSLEWGFSKQILRTIAEDPKNLVVLTEKPNLSSNEKTSIARTLWQWWNERQDGVATEQTTSGDTVEQVFGGGRELEVEEAKREAIKGTELNLYQQWLATQRQLQATLQSGGATVLETVGDGVDDASSESSTESEESETEQQGRALNVSTTMGQASRKKVVLKDEDLGINILLKKKGVYDFDVRGKRGRERMFPIPIRRKRNDEFGELIRPEDFLRAEEREEADGQDAAQGDKGSNEEGLGKKRKWDDIGAKKGGSGGPNKRPQPTRTVSDDIDVLLPSEGSAGVADELDGVEDPEEEELLGPSKLAISKETIAINLRIAFVDFSGLHDKRSLTMLIPLIQPRKLILVSGSEEETLALAGDCKKLIGTTDGNAVDILTPAVGASVDASVDTNAWIVKLADPLVRRLKWQNVRGLGIVTVTAMLLATEAAEKEKHPHAIGDDEGANKRQKTAEEGDAKDGTEEEEEEGGEAGAVVPTLDVLPTTMASAARSVAQPLHVGDLRLTDLRRAMQSSGHTAEFRGEGILLIDGSVAVRKSATGRIELESIGLPTDGGPAMQQGGTFYAVKRMIYNGLAVVAGA
ncbi:putative cleavage and polyadenylylation specificity protein [Phaeoacremonium minimum UCRPA7]|uniref:Cleavage and polyadenylation specificity factor subunit 2 n=1 Tax=Phaeoacremonium minimum (strain UCR-PA7) TaxID=1286976 RepID=R8BHU5_PHAM7|nr:putative cleavage and polyadenylylation specificity protein [Phaeoacremonium minimum UCRPA7]EON98881.1 putative cleavage and polyadenylylation specificity protein [Phaeoacremonium minimum UCRPA7]